MEEVIDIQNILPANWFDDNGGGDVYVSVYHCLTDILERIQKTHKVGHIFNATFLIINTDLEYQNVDFVFKGISEHQPLFEQDIQIRNTGQNVFLFFFLKHD